MTSLISQWALLLAYATFARAQFGPPGNGGSPFGNGGPFGGNPGDGSPFGGPFGPGFFESRHRIVTAHAVLAVVAFAFLLPVGGIVIRLGSFRGAWILHAVCQVIAFFIYLGAFGLGIYMATSLNLMHHSHPIIGIVLMVVLLVQPFLGLLHHLGFKKNSKRGFFSYIHIWLGRIAITLGIINGGLGLQLAQTRFFAATQGQIIGYAVGAGVIWLIYVAVAIFGETRRQKNKPAVVQEPQREKRESDGESDAPPQYA